MTIGETRALRGDATLRLPAGSIVRVECGAVLVTHEGDPEDHVLQRGDFLEVPWAGLSVAWAFTDSSISISFVAERMAA